MGTPSGARLLHTAGEGEYSLVLPQNIINMFHNNNVLSFVSRCSHTASLHQAPDED